MKVEHIKVQADTAPLLNEPVIKESELIKVQPDTAPLLNESVIKESDLGKEPKDATKSVLLWMFINLMATIVIVFVNKKIFSDPNLVNMQISFTAFHFLCTFMTLSGVSKLGMLAPKDISIIAILPLCLIFSLNVIFPNLSLAYSSVTFYQVSRILVTPGTAIINLLVYGINIRGLSAFSIVPVCSGVGIMAYFDSIGSHKGMGTSLLGVAFAIMGVIVSSIYVIWIAKYSKQENCTAAQLLYRQAPISAILLILAAPFIDTFPDFAAVDTSMFYLVLLSGVCAMLINVSQFYIVQGTSPLTSTVVGHAKTCSIVGLSWILGKPANSMSILGVLIAIGGIILYSYSEYVSKYPQQSTNDFSCFGFRRKVLISIVAVLIIFNCVFFAELGTLTKRAPPSHFIQLQSLYDMDAKGPILTERSVDTFTAAKNIIPKSTSYFLVATVVKNKGIYLPEWIESLLLQGVDKIVIYNNNGNDKSLEYIKPYIEDGIVDWINWPRDYANLSSSVYDWHDKGNFDNFKKWYDSCTSKTNDPYGRFLDCETSAIRETVARYRKHSWIAYFDVDEIFFVNDPKSCIVDYLRKWEGKYNYLNIGGYNYGTNGYYHSPTRSVNLPFPLVSEIYRYRLSLPLHKGAIIVQDHTWMRHSIAYAKSAYGSEVRNPHNWDMNEKKREISKPVEIFMNHYRFLSVEHSYRKAKANMVERDNYRSQSDYLLNEIADYTVGFISELIRSQLLRRLNMGAWEGLPLGSKATMKQCTKSNSAVCISFISMDEELHLVRKAVVSLAVYLKSHDPNLDYNINLFIRKRDNVYGYLDENNLEPIAEMIENVNCVKFLESDVSVKEAYNLAQSDCSKSKFVMFLNGEWETRFMDPLTNKIQVGHESEGFLTKANVFNFAVELLDKDPQLLEVWLGETPLNLVQKSEWKNLTAVDGSSILYRKLYSENDKSAAPFRWHANLRRTELSKELLEMDNIMNVGLANDSAAATFIKSRGQYSAHLCLTNNEPIDCYLKIDSIDDRLTTGLMWRQRIVLVQ